MPLAYRSIKAYVILKCYVGLGHGSFGGLPGSLTVISLRGTFNLDIIDELSGMNYMHCDYLMCVIDVVPCR